MEIISTATGLLIANKLLGKTAEKISDDLANVYLKGRDMIIDAATRKSHLEKDGMVNLRVARDVFWNGSYTDEVICAEYFGGVLATARTQDGVDDSAIYYLDIIKSLSSNQLKLHYALFNRLNTLLSDDKSKDLNLSLDKDVHSIKVWFDAQELSGMGIDLDLDLEALYRKGLIHEYRINKVIFEVGTKEKMLFFTPTSLGIHVFAVANNKLCEWRSFGSQNFGDFPDTELPATYSFTKPEWWK